MKLKKRIKNAALSLQTRYYLQGRHFAVPGSVNWLIATELKYGGLQKGVPRQTVSPKDTRSESELARGGMMGGDRMLIHAYASKYAQYLAPFLNRSAGTLTLTEFGILRGNGLAIWCDLFADQRVIGLDIDLGHVRSNTPVLESLGAFTRNQPELHEYDQLVAGEDRLRTILAGDTIDICIDDGLHSIDSIMTTLASAIPHLSKDFVYIIEDNREVHTLISERYPQFRLDYGNELTVLSPAA